MPYHLVIHDDLLPEGISVDDVIQAIDVHGVPGSILADISILEGQIKTLDGDLTGLIDAYCQLEAMFQAINDVEIVGDPDFHETFVKAYLKAKPIIERWKQRKFGEDSHA
jgi:hypothetical protein